MKINSQEKIYNYIFIRKDATKLHFFIRILQAQTIFANVQIINQENFEILMNTEHLQLIRKQFRYLQRLNLLTRIPWLQRSEEQIMRHFINKSLDYLKRRRCIECSVNFFHCMTIVLGQMKNNQVYTYILFNLSELFRDIIGIVFNKCEVTEKVFQKIDPKFWQEKWLVFVESKIQNIMLGDYHKVMFEKIQKLYIISDPIGNTGMKRLMSIEMNNLQQFKLGNTNCTSDVIKLFKKKERSNYSFFQVQYQQKFNYLLFYKESVHYKATSNGHSFNTRLFKFQDTLKSIYLGHVSKIYKQPENFSVIIKTKPQFNLQYYKENALLSEKSWKVMEDSLYLQMN